MDRLSLFADGFMFSSESMASTTRRHAATILIALTDTPFELEVAGQVRQLHALALRPSVTKRLGARNAPFACVDLSVNHPKYRHFLGIAGDGCMPMSRHCLVGLLPDWLAFHGGHATASQIDRLYLQTVDLMASLLPTPKPLDKRVQQVVAHYGRSSDVDLAQMVQATGLSRDRLSHLFSQHLGISLRTYALLCKVFEAARYHHSKKHLTQIAQAAGFADSAHFSNVWTQTYGKSPGYFFGSDSVQLYSQDRVQPPGQGDARDDHAHAFDRTLGGAQATVSHGASW